jgi:hypothetical protein
MVIAIPFLVALVGLLMYVLMSNPKAVEAGRILFGAGLLAGLLRFSGAAVSLIQR